ncbi:hypothetical protein JB92DRAFT_2690816, partial [Gautieria morchelliformis]
EVQHRPGRDNPVADGLSRNWQEAQGTNEKDGSTWLVLLDWEANKGIVNDIHMV